MERNRVIQFSVPLKNYKLFEEFLREFRDYFNPRYIKAFKIIYLRDHLGFKWTDIALLVKVKRTACIEKYRTLKKNPRLLFKDAGSGN